MTEPRPWTPMTRDQFRTLPRGGRLRERHGRVWSVHTAAIAIDGLARVTLWNGTVARQVDERFADDYMLLLDEPGTGATSDEPR